MSADRLLHLWAGAERPDWERCTACGEFRTETRPQGRGQYREKEECPVRLRAALDEAEMTLANERGTGVPPCDGWTYHLPHGRTPRSWIHRERGFAVYHHPTNSPGAQWAGGELGGAEVLFSGPTARAAMRAAPTAG